MPYISVYSRKEVSLNRFLDGLKQRRTDGVSIFVVSNSNWEPIDSQCLDLTNHFNFL